MSPASDLIFDIGMSEGDDADFYLRKGFRVVGLEANPETYAIVQRRFATEVASGMLTIFNLAAAECSGEQVPFMLSGNQGHSHLAKYPRADDNTARAIQIETIDWPTLTARAGAVPHYCKIDIEGAEVHFLRSMLGQQLPEYISTECHGFAPIEILYQIGYRRFRILHQHSHNAFEPPAPPREGKLLQGYAFKHSSGYFGRELYGERWLDFRETAVAFNAIELLRNTASLPHIWFDCHAWLPLE